MEPSRPLRSCTFCADAAPILAAVRRDGVERISVMCAECGAVGPMATADDPSGHAEHLWNQRFGIDQYERGPLLTSVR
jgi:hypothetical protein